MNKFSSQQFLFFLLTAPLLSSFMSGTAFSETNSSPSIEQPPSPRDQIVQKELDSLNRKHEVQIGTETFYSLFQRRHGRIALQGWMYGFNGRYTYRPRENDLFHFKFLDMYRLEGLYSFGKVDYSSPGSGADYNVKDFMYEYRALLGKDLPVSEKTFVTPYLGFGYRYLRDDTGGRLTSDSAYGYLRQSSYWYLPLGIDLTTALSPRWQIVANAEYDHWIQGLLKSRFSDGTQFTTIDNDNIDNDQKRGLGVRGSIKLIHQGKIVNFFIEPFIRYWHVKESKAETASVDGFDDIIIERKNKTTESGVRLGVQF